MTVTIVAGRYVLNVPVDRHREAAIVAQDLGKASNNDVLGRHGSTPTAPRGASRLTNPQGDKAKALGGFKYSAAGGLATGVCTSVCWLI